MIVKKTLIMILLSLLLLPALLLAQTKPLNYLLLGQSNMSGQGVIAELNDNQLRMPENVTFYLHGKPASFQGLNKFGPELSFSQSISKKHPNQPIRLIKFAPGGSLMKDWVSTQTGKHYDTLIKQVKKVSGGNLPKIQGVLWMHGERDTKSKELAVDYEQHLTQFIAMLKHDFKHPNLSFVIARTSIPRAFRPAVNEVRVAQQRVAKMASVSLISTDDLSTTSDKVHFDTQGQLLLGQRFSQSIQ